MITEITQQNFDAEVLGSTVPVLVDFWASWCGPCRMLSPVVDELAEQYDGKVKFGKINVDEQPRLAMNYSVESIPTLLLFKDDFADCMIPFLMQHYSEICVIDLTKTGSRYQDIVDPSDYTQALFLCSLKNWDAMW